MPIRCGNADGTLQYFSGIQSAYERVEFEWDETSEPLEDGALLNNTHYRLTAVDCFEMICLGRGLKPKGLPCLVDLQMLKSLRPCFSLGGGRVAAGGL